MANYNVFDEAVVRQGIEAWRPERLAGLAPAEADIARNNPGVLVTKSLLDHGPSV